MNRRTSVVNISGDHPETVLQLAKHLGTSQMRRKIFDVIYGRGTKPRSKKQIMEKAGIANIGTKAQQAQNELDYLARHHLIVKMENDGSVDDGSRNLYGKDETVRAVRSEIVKFADNPKAAAREPTKRRPVVSQVAPLREIKKSDLKRRKKLTVLYLCATPEGESPLRVDLEAKRIQEHIRGSRYRDNVTVEYRPAADLDSLLNGLNDVSPQIVHFSGHSNEDGIALDTGKSGHQSVQGLTYDQLAQALAATDNPPEVVVLNSCKSSEARKHLIPGAKIVIAMRTSVTDHAATTFATRFYAAIASGQSVKAAFEQGKIAVSVGAIAEADTPELIYRRDIDPASVVLT